VQQVETKTMMKMRKMMMNVILFACIDTYAKLTLMSPNGQEITHSKTSVRRGQPNPLYKETFMFQVPESQLPEVTLMVSVFYNRNIKRKEMIGWFSLGNTNTNKNTKIQMGICRARLTNCPGALTNVRMLCETGEL